MSEKIKKSFSQCLATFALIVISVLVLLNATGTDFTVPEVKAGEATSSASGQVGNATPIVSAVNVASTTIDLNPNNTTSVIITGTITDTNGGSDISSATATLYATSTNENCSANDNTCYISITCTLGAAVGNDRNATCTTNIWFHSNPGGWGASILAADNSNATGTATDTVPSTVNTLNAVIVTESITYDTLSPGNNMASTTKTIYATTTGNAAIDVQIKGNDMTYGATGTIVAANERYATSTVGWVSGNIASSTNYVNFEVDLAKPTTHPSDSADIIYWGWSVPGGTPIGTYSGTLFFNPVSD